MEESYPPSPNDDILQNYGTYQNQEIIIGTIKFTRL